MASTTERPLDDLRTTLSAYGRILRTRWRSALVAFCAIGGLAFWTSQYLPRNYRATTIFERRDDVVLRNLIQTNSPYSFDNLKSSMALDMTGSRALAEAAIQTGLLKPEAIRSSGDALTHRELAALDAVLHRYGIRATLALPQSSPSHDTIELRCEANDPAIAQAFVTSLRDRYIVRTRERISEVLAGTKAFFETELRRYEQQIASATSDLKADFEEFPGVDPTDAAAAGERLETLRTARLRAEERLSDVSAQISAREQFLLAAADLEPAPQPASAPAPAVRAAAADPERVRLSGELARIEREIAGAVNIRRMTDSHPHLQGLRREADGVRSALAALPAPAVQESVATAAAAEPPSPVAGHRLRVELELRALREQQDAAVRAVDDAAAREQRFARLYDRILTEGDVLRAAAGRMDEDVATAAVWREHLAQLSRVAAADSEARGTQFAILEEPKEVRRALRPQALAVMLICVGCGVAAAVLLVSISELCDRSLRSAGQAVRALGIPVLECVGEIDTPAVVRRRWLARLAWAPAVVLLAAVCGFSGWMAYASLEMPEMHKSAAARVNTALRMVGARSAVLTVGRQPAGER